MESLVEKLCNRFCGVTGMSLFIIFLYSVYQADVIVWCQIILACFTKALFVLCNSTLGTNLLAGQI